MLAHEVRNPLTNVNLSAEQLEMELADEEQKFYTQIIKRNCTRINDLITQLLEPSTSEDIELVESSVHSVLSQAISAALDRVQLKRIQIVNEFAEEELALPLDQVSLQVAFLNLITNAIEAMEEDKGVLRITTQNNSDTHPGHVYRQWFGNQRRAYGQDFRAVFYWQKQRNGHRFINHHEHYPCAPRAHRGAIGAGGGYYFHH
jgi:signal transduction histidine kinase